MKKLFARAAVLALGVLGLVLQGCNKPESTVSGPIPMASADVNSFKQVTAQLEPGGDLFVYLSTEQLVNGLADKVSKVREVVNAIPNTTDTDREKINKAFEVVTSLIKDSGIQDVSGFGASSLMRQRDIYHNKCLLHHYPGKGEGFLWTMFGSKPHPLDGLELLPESTAIAYFADLDLPMLWSVIQKEVNKASLPEADQALAKVPEMFEKATGLKWDQVLGSLGGEYGFALLLDESRKVALPIPGQAVDIPEPGLLIVMKVKDDTIFNRLEALMKQSGQQITAVDKPDLKMRTLPLPMPLPIPVRPTIARSGNYLLIANTDTVIQQALAIKAGQAKGLKSTAEFAKLSKDVPTQGNNFSFVSQRFGQTILNVQQTVLQHRSDSNSAKTDWLQSLVGTNAAGCGFSVSANTDEGWLCVGNNNQHPAKILAAAAVVPATVAAIAVPAFVKAREAAQKRSHQSESQNQ